MDSHRQSNVKFWVASVIVFVVSAAALAALWPSALSAARATSSRLASDGQADRGVTTADYQLAVWLNPGNQTARLGLAAAQIEDGQAAAALATLGPAGQGSAVGALRVRAFIEDNQPVAAAAAGGGLVTQAPTDTNIELVALADASAGRPLTQNSSLISRLTSSEALQAVNRTDAGELPLAAELYATGLLHSSRRILLTLPQSYERNLLLANVDYDIHTQSTLTQASSVLSAAIAMNPADISTRQLLVQVYRAQGKPAEAFDQTTAIAKLQSGRP